MTEQNNPKPNKFKSTEEAVKDLLDANIMLMSVIDQLHTRIQTLEERISHLEQSDAVTTKCLNAQADQLDRLNKEVFDEDPLEVEE